VINTNLHSISYRFQVIAFIGPIFAFHGGYLCLAPSPPKLNNIKFGVKKLETSLHRMVWNLFRYIFWTV